MSWRIEHGDCLDVMRAMPDASVDAVVTDPPYFRVKSLAWDRQWGSAEKFLAWIGELADEWRRILRPNGSLYVFASPRMAARVECEIGRRFAVLNSIVWAKHDGNGNGMHSRACKTDLRAWFPQTERIVFAEQSGADSTALGGSGYGAKCDELRGFVFEPLRAYLDGERMRAGVTIGELHGAWCAERNSSGNMMSHWFGRSQWMLPTRANYDWLRGKLNATGSGDYLRREYEDLRREYEDLRRPFSVTADVPYTDVWTFPTVAARPGKHPCEKPLDLLRHIIGASTRPGAVVLDCFAGSGSTGEAAMQLGRDFIGVEKDDLWAQRARRRLATVAPLVVDAATPTAPDLPLFAASGS